MNHFASIAAALESYELDAMLLTGSANRFYATGFACDEEGGVALVTKQGNFFFTDSRYIEAAEACIEDAAIGLVDREKGYIAWLNEALELSGAETVGFEEDKMTYIFSILSAMLSSQSPSNNSIIPLSQAAASLGLMGSLAIVSIPCSFATSSIWLSP